MTRRGSILLIAVVVGAHLLPPITTTAQAPSDAFDVFVVSDHGLVQYACQRVEPTPATQEAPHETETPYAPPTFTPVILASSTPTFPTPTQETSTSPTVAATPIIKNTVTPTPYPTQATTPTSACIGTVTADRGLYVRAAPYGAWLGSLWFGQRVELHGYTDVGDRWYRIWWASSGTWGYISAAYVKTAVECWGLIEG